MEAGKISLVESDSNSLEEFYGSNPTDKASPFDELAETVEIKQEVQLEDGRTGYSGLAAIEQIESVEQPSIAEGGGITQEERLEKQVIYTEFVFVPDSFLAVGSSKGEFLIPLLTRQTSHTVFPAKIDMEVVIDYTEEANVWKIGFEDRGEEVENGVIHGMNLFDDPEIGDLLGILPKNQLGIRFQFGDDLANVFVTKSGYVEIYQPDHFDTEEFIRYVEKYILPGSEIK